MKNPFAAPWRTLGLCIACLAMLALSPLHAADKQLRIGTLAPKNSLYHRQLLEVGEVWRAAQGGNAKYLVYPDGSQGGEAELARRMRIGQLQGALISVVGLREIEPSVAALQNLPLLFRSWDEVDYVREKMRPAMEKKFFGQRLCRSGLGGFWLGTVLLQRSCPAARRLQTHEVLRLGL
jgi:TRAP-type C4-dicarboxylate transport system substrate-binding protein